MPKLKPILLSIAGVLGMVLFLYLLSGRHSEYWLSFLLVGINGLLLAWPAARVISGHEYWFSPHVFTLVAFGAYFFVGTVAAIYVGPYSRVYDRLLSPDELSVGLAVTNVGLLSYLIGARLAPKRTTLTPGLEWYFTDTPAVQRNFGLVTVGVWAIGICAWAYMFAVGGGIAKALQNFSQRRDLITGAGGYVYHLSKFAYVGSLLFFSRYGLKPLAFLFLGFTAVPLLAFGSRSFVGILVLSALIVYRFRHTRRIPLLVWVGMGVGLFFLMTVYVLLRQTAGNIDRAWAIYERSTQTVEGRVSTTFGNMMFIIPLTEMVDNAGGRVPYDHGRALVSFFYFIPQFVWPGQTKFKPAAYMYGATFFPNTLGKTTMTPSILADFYMGFGWPSLIGLSFALGFGIKWLSNLLLGNPHRRYQVAYVVYAALFGVNMLRVVKNGVPELNMGIYFLIPIVIVYAPNFGLLMAPPRASSSDSGLLEA